ncbi:hypothetical protein [Mesorhizobium sp. GbtcB19]|uniref:hypothetical protein n=1 Tax=Mesorhizobium sp. GbtcB19 TaxID=2824764 RepID=UPI001C303F1D|nr:hypothetical protein [Mesorhizobium sp. GbtcB19]
MAMKPNYRYERSKRDQAKAAKKDAKLAAKAAKGKDVEQEGKGNADDGGVRPALEPR